MNEGPRDLYCYRVTLLRVVDGDTIDVDIDLGFKMTMARQRLRLLGRTGEGGIRGVNTPEMRGEERERGRAAKERVEQLLHTATDLRIESFNRDSFGRVLCCVQFNQGDGFRDLGRTLVVEEFAEWKDYA
jgi:micrococcal nuclease